MSIIDHLWDDTVAGPRPSGLQKLRRSAAAASLQVTRSITILRNGSLPDSASEPASPASAPVTPRTPTTPQGEGYWKKLRRKQAGSGLDPAEHRNPTACDWVVISALDR